VSALALPGGLPSVASARLPALYEGARSALAQCERVDECREWANKAEAIASYARQSHDDTLYNTAMRIKSRAIRRCGELLKEIPAEPGNHVARLPGATTATKQLGTPSAQVASPRQEAARTAGLSQRQAKQAVRVASVPSPLFERMVEAPKPATVTELAEVGKRPTPKPLVDLGSRSPSDFKLATAAQGQLREFGAFAAKSDPAAVARGSSPRERHAMREQIAAIKPWLARLGKELES
jgi:hypothetical protein